jgi:NAD(P)-dependent dehydrogenase (short-subunit alcohol dehydrogenase family)
VNNSESFGFHGSGLWGVILGGSSGFGLATARRLARAGLNLIVGHRDKASAVESELGPQFDFIRAQGVRLVTRNGNLFDEDVRGDLFQSIEENAGPGGVHVFLHSIAAGSCKPVVDGPNPPFQQEALQALAEVLSREGIAVSAETLRKAVNEAFHEKGCDALYTLADSRLPYSDEILEEDDLARTMAMMGYDYLLWGRELATRGLLTKTARLVALTSQGNEVAWKGYAAVSAAKAAMEALCRSMAVELAPLGVRSYLVQAGITDTPAGNGIPQFDLLKAQARLRNPFHRLTTPEDVADAIFALCLPMFNWANGTIIRIDGGEAISGA